MAKPFDVIDDNFLPSWKDVYSTNNNSIKTHMNYEADASNTPYSQWDVNKYETLTTGYNQPGTWPPKMSPVYNDTIQQNYKNQMRNDRYNLPSEFPLQPQQPLHIPSSNPPYGTSYPTDGYSPYDASLATDSSMVQFYANAPVPLSSPVALEDARHSPPVSMADTKYIREGYAPMVSKCNCSDSVSHVKNCPVCSSYFTSDTKTCQVVIIFLILIIIILLVLLSRKK